MSNGFVEAFALFALGRIEEVLPAFLRAALRHPRAARMLVGERTFAPDSSVEAEDHNLGVSLRRSLRGYLEKQPLPAKRFFRSLIRDPRVMKLLDEAIAVVRRWREERHKGDRSAFDRMTRMHSRSFAEGEARKLHDLLPHSGARRSVVH